MEKVLDPKELRWEELVKIVRCMQEELFLDSDKDGDPFWSAEKFTDAEEVQQHMIDLLSDHDLYPTNGGVR